MLIGCGLLLSGLLSSLATRLVPAQPLPAGHISPAPVRKWTILGGSQWGGARAAPRAEMTVGATRSLLKVDDSGGFTVGWRATRRDDRADIGADASKRTRRRVWDGARSLLKEDDSV